MTARRPELPLAQATPVAGIDSSAAVRQEIMPNGCFDDVGRPH
jgi:hypothetical protein